MYIKIAETIGMIIGTILGHIKNLIFSIGLIYSYCAIFNKEFSWIATIVIYALFSFVYIPIRNYRRKKRMEQLKILQDEVE